MAEPALELRDLAKRFGTHQAVKSLDLTVAPGEFVTLLGPSGCGKTTTLNMIAGFIAPDSGSIRLAGRAVEQLAPFRRDLGIVFQDYALFPHRSVFENIAFGLRMRKVSRTEIVSRVTDAMQMVRLDGLGDRRPAQLSGGQRQRVALARALVIRPALLLLDEPLSNLDLKLREEMRAEISALQRRLGIAAVFVTHDQDEALTMSDRIAVMRAGRIEQLGSARAIYDTPATAFVATFIGSTNMIPATMVGPCGASGLALLRTPAGEVRIAANPRLSPGTALLLTVRPERLHLGAPDTAPPGLSALPAQVAQTTYLGSRSEVQVVLRDGTTVLATVVSGSGPNWAVGDAVEAWFRPEDAWTLPADTITAADV